MLVSGLLGLLLGLLTMDCPAWETIKHDGHDYVTLQSVKEFYQFDNIVRDGDSVTLENRSVTMTFKIGQRDCYLNNVRFLLIREIVETDSKLLISRFDLAKILDPILRPNYIEAAEEFRAVILDPGHGGSDPGYSNSLGSEAGYTLLLANKIKPLLKKRGFKVILTRDTDSTVSTGQRIALANQSEDPAVFISLHFSQGPDSERGIQTFRMAPQGVPHFTRAVQNSDCQVATGNAQDAANVAFAVTVHGSALRRLGSNTFDRGVLYGRFAELIDLEHPAIRFEGGFMSHSDEAGLIHSEAYQKALAQGIADAVLKYRYAMRGSPD